MYVCYAIVVMHWYEYSVFFLCCVPVLLSCASVVQHYAPRVFRVNENEYYITMLLSTLKTYNTFMRAWPEMGAGDWYV